MDRELEGDTPADAATAPAGGREELLDLEGERMEVLEGESGAAGLGEHVAVEVAAAAVVAVGVEVAVDVPMAVTVVVAVDDDDKDVEVVLEADAGGEPEPERDIEAVGVGVRNADKEAVEEIEPLGAPEEDSEPEPVAGRLGRASTEGVVVPDADGEGEAVLVLVLVSDTVLDAVVVTLAVRDLLLERDAVGVREGVALPVGVEELDAL